MTCVYDCRHPLWGGSGVCVTNDTQAGNSEACSCDAGFVTTDFFDKPSCVPERVLTVHYLAIATVGILSTGISIWHISQHQRMTESNKATRKAMLRLRGLLSTRYVQPVARLDLFMT